MIDYNVAIKHPNKSHLNKTEKAINTIIERIFTLHIIIIAIFA